MQIRSKIWLEVDGEPVLGSGRQALLRGIEEFGSINKAAKNINISYRKALGYISSMEQRTGKIMVHRQAGGLNGGGAKLSEDARMLLKKFNKLERGVNKMLDQKFAKVFDSQQ
ncbi:MAG: LysR family transcriptional regulator [Nitrospira sp.]|nr:LysR family transcriptional regulator [bacterium]MBL7049830.1 LysR family transcriptional regulator [Nitrospira sp.]